MPKADRPDVVGFSRTYAAGTRIAPHAHDAHQLIHAISGAMRVTATGRLWILPVGRALWIPAGVDHGILCNGAVAMRTAYLSARTPTPPQGVQAISVSPLAREVLVRLASDPAEGLRLTLGDVLIHEIDQAGDEPLSLPMPSDPRIAHLAEALRRDPSAPTPLSAWATQLGFSERNLIRRIRDETGMTFRELRRLTRVLIAIEMLVEGRSVTAAAFDVGFETPSAFIHAFRLVTGKTPRAFASSD